MKELIRPGRLKKGDKIATVSLSWGGAGDSDILWRYNQGKERLQTIFGLEVIEMPHTLKGTEYVYHHPQKRAEDFMAAFKDPSIKGIFSCIGGLDTIRLLPYIDFDIIHNNPKVFIGYSDTTVNHFMCLKAGLSSIYGPAILTDFAENVSMDNYTIEWLKRTLFTGEKIGNVPPAKEWTSEYLPWIIENKNTARKYAPNTGYELLQGKNKLQGRLIGGCLPVMEIMKGTDLFPTLDYFDDAILFLETSEDTEPVWYIECSLRNYGIMGVLNRIRGILWGKPYDNMYYEEYKEVIKKVLAEFGASDLPVLYNVSFGHTEPKICLPYGAMAEIDCEKCSFSILESAVI